MVPRRMVLRFVFAVLFAGCVLAQETPAQQPTADDIVKGLTPRPEYTARDLEAEPSRNAVPAIDLYINFKFDSAEIEPDAGHTIRSLGEALASPQLRKARIAIVGHTDAKGVPEYNLRLSERRAAAVRRMLVNVYKIEPGRLTVEGRGAKELKNAARPFDGVNQRVEIKNLGLPSHE
jgi:outer membrane protein OmpA-like peptidoglycan-associated protein